MQCQDHPACLDWHVPDHGCCRDGRGLRAPKWLPWCHSGGSANTTWRFMFSYKGAISTLIWFISIDTLLISRLITTHDPPSTRGEL